MNDKTKPAKGAPIDQDHYNALSEWAESYDFTTDTDAAVTRGEGTEPGRAFLAPFMSPAEIRAQIATIPAANRKLGRARHRDRAWPPEPVGRGHLPQAPGSPPGRPGRRAPGTGAGRGPQAQRGHARGAGPLPRCELSELRNTC